MANQKNPQPKEEWRKELQNRNVIDFMGSLGTGLNVVSFVVVVLACVAGRLSRFWVMACFFLSAVSLALYFLFPQYYSLMGKKFYDEAGYTADVKHLVLPVIGPAMALALRSTDFSIPAWWVAVVSILVMGVLLVVLFRLFSREARENGIMMLHIILLAIFLGAGIPANANHYLNPNPALPAEYEVTDLREVNGAKSPDSFYCYVEIETGREIEIPVDSGVFYKLDIGDKVPICRDTGALGIEYMYYVDE